MQKNKPEGKEGVVHRRFQLSVHSFHEEENTLNLFADFQSAAAAVAVSRLRGSSNPSRKITDKTVLQSVLLCAWDFDGSKDTSRALKRGPRPKRKQERKKAENTHSIKSAVLLLELRLVKRQRYPPGTQILARRRRRVGVRKHTHTHTALSPSQDLGSQSLAKQIWVYLSHASCAQYVMGSSFPNLILLIASGGSIAVLLEL